MPARLPQGYTPCPWLHVVIIYLPLQKQEALVAPKIDASCCLMFPSASLKQENPTQLQLDKFYSLWDTWDSKGWVLRPGWVPPLQNHWDQHSDTNGPPPNEPREAKGSLGILGNSPDTVAHESKGICWQGMEPCLWHTLFIALTTDASNICYSYIQANSLATALKGH